MKKVKRQGNNMNWSKILETIAQHKTFLISVHVHPDPDALCAQLALYLYLKSQGKRVVMINETKLADRFLFLPGAKNIKKARHKLKVSYDVAIVVDCGDMNRIGMVNEFIEPGKVVINIDHHITNKGFGDLNLVDSNASSASEIIYHLLNKAKFSMTRSIAMLLYVGMMTDTGSFRYDNTSAHTHRIVSELLQFKFSVNKLYQRLYETIPYNEVKCFTEIINNFELFCGGRVVCMELHRKVLKKFSEDFDLRDKIFRYLRAIKGVEVIVIVTENSKDWTRVNLRSQDKVDVARLASHFNGGGHKNASGCGIKADFKTAKKEILRQIKKVL